MDIAALEVKKLMLEQAFNALKTKQGELEALLKQTTEELYRMQGRFQVLNDIINEAKGVKPSAPQDSKPPDVPSTTGQDPPSSQ